MGAAIVSATIAAFAAGIRCRNANHEIVGVRIPLEATATRQHQQARSVDAASLIVASG